MEIVEGSIALFHYFHNHVLQGSGSIAGILYYKVFVELIDSLLV